MLKLHRQKCLVSTKKLQVYSCEIVYYAFASFDGRMLNSQPQ